MKSSENTENCDPPRILNFNLTWRCNLKCKMCNYWSRQQVNREELATDQIIDTIRAFKSRFEIEKVRFWGGEPFMRSDLVELINSGSSLSETLIITNGTLISNENATELIKKRPAFYRILN